MDYIQEIMPLILGWLLDCKYGDPAELPHPVVGFGKAISACENRFNSGSNRVLKGALVACGLIFATYCMTALLLHIFDFSAIISVVLKTAIVFFCLAGKTLADEVRAVFKAADCSLEAGRRQVARIVGRDTKYLTDQEVRIAALETLAENLSDGVIAPIFWYLIGGAPAMLAYKMVNTLDSMIGYHTERYLKFGRWAARIDDVANYIPARLTALLMLLVAKRLKLIKFVAKYGSKHASPNSGYPEAALAGILDCRFGGSHTYFGEAFDKPYIGENQRKVDTLDMVRAIKINRLSELAMLLLTAAILAIII
jgi:adenosylcobinamide-phosphate synthase